jgi:uncharacterized protein (TIGR02145 family)
MKKPLLFIAPAIMMWINTPLFSQLKDIEGNTYQVTEYQQATWMKENLRVTKLNDGTPIRMVKDNKEFLETKEPAFAWYKNDPELGKKYGGLYNWYAVNSGKLCPKGWHVADDDEWMILEVWILGMPEEAASEIGDRGTNQGITIRHPSAWNEKYEVDPSGFDALPAGLRADDGSFLQGNELKGGLAMNFTTVFWASTPYENGNAWTRSVHGTEKTIGRYPAAYNRGHSVRCVKDYQ